MKQYLPITTFPSGVRAIFSSAHDGSIAAGAGNADSQSHHTIRGSLVNEYFQTEHYSKLFVTYAPENTYTHIERLVDSEHSANIACDALYTTEDNAVMVLPVADCIATIVYDPVAHMLGVLHLGRHSSVAGLIETFAIEVADNVGSDPHDWHIWMSPSLKFESDRMIYFTPPHPEEWEQYMQVESDGMIHIDISGHNMSRFERLGVATQHIYVSTINTYTDTQYFSQRAADETGDTHRFGRMMVAASLMAT